MQIHLFSESLLVEEYLHKGGEQAMLTAGPLQDPSRIRPESASQSQKRLQKD